MRRASGTRVWVLALGLAAACGGGAPDAEVADDAGRSAAEATEAADARAAPSQAGGDTVYVDVRSPAEYAAGHVIGAINIPHTEMGDRWQELDQFRDDHLVLYCRSGRRSGIAQQILEDHGFDRLTNAGGLRDLQRQGAQVTR